MPITVPSILEVTVIYVELKIGDEEFWIKLVV